MTAPTAKILRTEGQSNRSHRVLPHPSRFSIPSGLPTSFNHNAPFGLMQVISEWWYPHQLRGGHFDSGDHGNPPAPRLVPPRGLF